MKIRVLETLVCYRELDSFLVLKNSSDELNGDIINECDIFNTIKWNVSIPRKSMEHSELIFSKWPMS